MAKLYGFGVYIVLIEAYRIFPGNETMTILIIATILLLLVVYAFTDKKTWQWIEDLNIEQESIKFVIHIILC